VISFFSSILFVAAAIFSSEKAPRTAEFCGWVAAMLILPIPAWFVQFSLTNRGNIGAAYIFTAAIETSACFIGLILLCFRRFRPGQTAIFLIFTFSLVLQTFSLLYWAHGTARDLSEPLTHLDAFYFALGTFTTAGTGNLSPISQVARGLQTLQMGVDFVLIGFIVVLVMARYTNLLDRPKAPRDVPPIAPPANWSDAT
jgi:hypothetical protein